MSPCQSGEHSKGPFPESDFLGMMKYPDIPFPRTLLPNMKTKRSSCSFNFGMVASLLLLASFTSFAQRTHEVGSAADLRAALTSAQSGDRVVLKDGTYDLAGDMRITKKGRPDKPIVIVAKNRGKAVISGPTRFILTASEHIVFEGLDLRGTVGPAIELRGCTNIRITRNHFQLNESGRSSWVLVDGIAGDSTTISGHNRIDHNAFAHKSHLGNFVTIEGTLRADPQISQYDRIDHNLFADIGPRVENVLEAIRVGSSTYSLSSGHTVIEENLFERCDGDPEYLSIKASDNTIRGNTFLECLGSLSLRHGNRNTVEGNVILGNGRTGSFLDSTGKTWTLGTGGLRFYGTGMRVLSNYIEGLTGTEWDATMAITGGDAEYGDGQSLTKHFRIREAVVAGNMLVNNASNIELGYNGGGFQGNWWPMAPIGLVIERNIIVGSRDTLIKFFNPPVQTTWRDNIVWPVGKAVASTRSIEGVIVKDPQLVQTSGIWHLPGETPRWRPLTRKDVGPGAP